LGDGIEMPTRLDDGVNFDLEPCARDDPSWCSGLPFDRSSRRGLRKSSAAAEQQDCQGQNSNIPLHDGEYSKDASIRERGRAT
jgi:hypothetical protein